jgi:hypothetical protein
MVMDLLRVVRHPDPWYLAGSVRETKCTRLGYGTRLSRLHTLDPTLALAFPRGSHSATRDLGQKNNQGTSDRSHVPQADLSATRLHNSDKKWDREKATDHIRVKICKKNRHKIEAQFYEHNRIQGETENS